MRGSADVYRLNAVFMNVYHSPDKTVRVYVCVRMHASVTAFTQATGRGKPG